ncbi:hypothetical protein RHSIM_Rhsim13G0168800 [Rhododendron simsii]|uniref:PGG domain-containing protein n=1 Tax=Rhododendron simsii TaxID=118357 RepID=A0A834L6P9_RHOSS|nr:hypothetical protein RHSIM_Rhsim13G0168800 [Rhododendron simsii]
MLCVVVFIFNSCFPNQIACYVLGMETKDVNETNGCGTTIRKSLQKIKRHVLGKGTNEEEETVDVNVTNASGHFVPWIRNKAVMWILIVTMWLAITSMAITYALSNIVVTPKKDRRSVSNTITIGVIVWSSVMALLLVKHTFGLVVFVANETRRKWKATRTINEKAIKGMNTPPA